MRACLWVDLFFLVFLFSSISCSPRQQDTPETNLSISSGALTTGTHEEDDPHMTALIPPSQEELDWIRGVPPGLFDLLDKTAVIFVFDQHD